MAFSEQPDPIPASARAPATTDIQTPPISIPPPLSPPGTKEDKGGGTPTSIEQFVRTRGYFDAVLVVLVLGFAFLSASFSVGHSDFFRQLAIGRLLAHGEYHFGVDPFIYSAENDYWVNHSWLFALLIYGLYQLPGIGAAATIFFKAVCVAALAEVMLRTGRRVGQSLWIPAVCTVLALLAASTRFYMRPDFLSFLFLALTLWLLTAARREGGKQLLWWLLPPMFVLWANCDQWFFLGPLTVALYLVGEMLQYWFALEEEEGADEARRRDLGRLGLVLAAGLAACLVNPHHIHVFAVPPEFGGQATGDLAQHDPQFRAFLLSPLRKNYYDPRLGLSASGLAFWPLLAVGLVSFVCVFGRVPWWRLLVWLPFALLGLYSTRAIPFFAVVGGPIAALNWLDFAASRLGTVPRRTRGWRAWSLFGRTLTAVVILAMLAATVPGWLQAQPYESHRIGWRVVPDASLEQAALQIRAWREQGLLPAEPRWFNTRPDIASYLAWFAPGERVFLDPQLTRFPEAAADYLLLREGLDQEAADEAAAEQGSGEAVSLRKDWRRILRKYGVRFWIFDNILNLNRPEMVARRDLFRDPDEWVPCYLRGRVAIFAWKDRRAEDATDPSRGLAVDFERLAFAPGAEPAPPEEPEAVPPRNLWETWWKPTPPASSLDKETAALNEMRFLFSTPRFVYANSRVWQETVAVSSIGLALPLGPAPNSLLALSWSATYHDLFPPGAMLPSRPPLPRESAALRARAIFVSGQDAGPTDSLYLGIRAARRALRINPRDAQTYFLLAQAYSHLDSKTQERTLKAPRGGQLAEIRRTQIVAALQNCLRFQPAPRAAAEAHGILFSIFSQLRYLDAAVYHLREHLNIIKQEGPQLGESSTQYSQRVETISKELTGLDEQLERLLNQYEVDAGAKTTLQKVQTALERGLAETAWQTLEKEPSSEVKGPHELALIARLTSVLLDLGRLDKARDLLPDPEQAGDQPLAPVHLPLQVRLAAASGDYARADRYLADAIHHAWKDPQGQSAGIAEAKHVGQLVGRVLLCETYGPAGTPRMPLLLPTPSDFWLRRWRLEALEASLAIEQQRDELFLLRGWLALEAGQNNEARRNFQVVSDSVVSPSRWIPEVDKLHAFFDPNELAALLQINLRQNVARSLAARYLKWLNQYQR